MSVSIAPSLALALKGEADPLEEESRTEASVPRKETE